ncbi:hypothetical protein HZS_8049, partial [Henneguya salminicola]
MGYSLMPIPPKSNMAEQHMKDNSLPTLNEKVNDEQKKNSVPPIPVTVADPTKYQAQPGYYPHCPPSYYDQNNSYRYINQSYSLPLRFPSYDPEYQQGDTSFLQNYDQYQNYAPLFGNYSYSPQCLPPLTMSQQYTDTNKNYNYHPANPTGVPMAEPMSLYHPYYNFPYIKNDRPLEISRNEQLNVSEKKLIPKTNKPPTRISQHPSSRSNSCYSPASKRNRMTYNKSQLDNLEREFIENNFIHRQRRNELAELLNLSERQIKIWFQNRRMKKKKEQKYYTASGIVKGGLENTKYSVLVLILKTESFSVCIADLYTNIIENVRNSDIALAKDGFVFRKENYYKSG